MDFWLPKSLLADAPWEIIADPIVVNQFGHRFVQRPAGRCGARYVRRGTQRGFLKPGYRPNQISWVKNTYDLPIPNLIACREAVASVLASWIGVDVPGGELFVYDDHPCWVSFDLGPDVVEWNLVMKHDDNPASAHRSAATTALSRYASSCVLSVLTGKHNDEGHHHLYSPERARWYSIDNAESFNAADGEGAGELDRIGRTHPELMRKHFRGSRETIANALDVAEAIPVEQLRALFELMPEGFATRQQCDVMLAFLIHRQQNIRRLVDRVLLPDVPCEA